MHRSTFDILRCPYCGGRLDLVTSSFHQTQGDEIQHGILGCQCCVFPVVDGIPVMHLQPSATQARELVEQGDTLRARRVMFGLEGNLDRADRVDKADQAVGERVDALIASNDATYRTIVEAFGEYIEGGYFLYRFADPTFIIGHAVARAVAGTVLKRGGRAIDICGGSGHLTRSLMDLSSPAPVLADLYFAKIWLARRFTAPGCEPVCCDGNSPMPFARGAFRYAMCSDAFMYIWTKRQFVQDMLRLTDNGDGGRESAAVISHTHNQCTWTPSHGQPLTPDGYRNLFETIEPRIVGESSLFADVVSGGPLDLSRQASTKMLEAEAALTIIATRHPGVFVPQALEPPPDLAQGEFRVNPLYAVSETSTASVMFHLRFPSEDYEQEYGACRQYLPAEVTIPREALSALAAGRVPVELADLLRRRVIVDLPLGYGAPSAGIT
jgi:uncharacterized protein YbaR (Trm112 family)